MTDIIDEIEITEAMIEAGISALLFYEDESCGGLSQASLELIVSAVYVNMVAQRPSASPTSGQSHSCLSRSGRREVYANFSPAGCRTAASKRCCEP